MSQARHVVERHYVLTARCDHQVTLVARQAAQGRTPRIDHAAQQRRAGRLGAALLAADRHHRVRAAPAQASEFIGDREDEVVVAGARVLRSREEY